MKPAHWEVDDSTRRFVEDNYRTSIVDRLAGKTPLEIIRELTFDGVAPGITVEHIDRLLAYVERHFLDRPLSGAGIELGAGTGTISAVVARRRSVTRMVALEITPAVVERLMPKVVPYILGGEPSKVEGVVGDFDRIKVPDATFDFAIEFMSLHHSDHPAKTLAETHRVLKPGAVLVAIDKARPDWLAPGDLQAMLDKEYEPEFKRMIGVDPARKLTRRMNGEREYRLQDWLSAFRQAGFRSVRHWNLAHTRSGGAATRLVKRTLSMLPPRVQHPIVSRLPERVARSPFTLSSENRVYTMAIDPFPKDASLLVATA